MKKLTILVCLFLIGFSSRCFAEGTPSAYSCSPSLGDKIFYKIIEFLFLRGESKEISYNITLSSPSAKNIILYLPFPYYKGKPYKKVLKWLKEYLEYEKTWGGYIPDKVDLIDTEYGKMLYIYIPQLPAGSPATKVHLSIEDEGPRSLKTNPRTMIVDYKLTYEDKIKPQDEWISPKTEKHTIKILNMPIYVQFEGNELNIDFCFGTNWCDLRMNLAGLHYEITHTFTTTGWHWIPIKKEVIAPINIKKEVKEIEEKE